MSPIPYSPNTGCMIPGIVSEDVASEYFSIPWTRDDAQFPTPMIATLISPNFYLPPKLIELKMDASIFSIMQCLTAKITGNFIGASLPIVTIPRTPNKSARS